MGYFHSLLSSINLRNIWEFFLIIICLFVSGPLPTTGSGNKYIMSMTDYFTKFVDLYALPTKEAVGVAQSIKTFVSRLVCAYVSQRLYLHIKIVSYCTHTIHDI